MKTSIASLLVCLALSLPLSLAWGASEMIGANAYANYGSQANIKAGIPTSVYGNINYGMSGNVQANPSVRFSSQSGMQSQTMYSGQSNVRSNLYTSANAQSSVYSQGRTGMQASPYTSFQGASQVSGSTQFSRMRTGASGSSNIAAGLNVQSPFVDASGKLVLNGFTYAK